MAKMRDRYVGKVEVNNDTFTLIMNEAETKQFIEETGSDKVEYTKAEALDLCEALSKSPVKKPGEDLVYPVYCELFFKLNEPNGL